MIKGAIPILVLVALCVTSVAEAADSSSAALAPRGLEDRQLSSDCRGLCPSYSATLYLWGAGIQGETAGGADLDVGFDTLIRNLRLAFMGAFEARQGRWSLLANALYLNVGIEEGATLSLVTPSGSPVDLRADARATTKGWVLGLLGGYELARSERGSLGVLLGTRFLDLSLDFDLDLATSRRYLAAETSVSQSAWDAVVGLRGRVELGDGWHLPWWVDVGTGQSDLTWQAMGGVSRSFDWGDVSLLYRYMAWDFGADERLDHIAFSGPVLAATWRF